MSYQVLARKWRPLRFDDVVGQDHITRTLKRAVEAGRVSHAYLFAGPRGCGKTSTARILARVLNCESATDGKPCNECASCLGVIAGNNLDVMEIDGASHTGVDAVRDLQESIGYAPSQYRNKVYVIDEVHMLSTHAFNALLKTLEEPPAHVYFIFATTAPNKIPDTIKSRCQRHHFKRLDIAEISGRLQSICEAEEASFEPEALRLLARKADGSMRDGTSLLDQCITASDEGVTAASVRDILGMIDQGRIVFFMRAIAAADAASVLRGLDRAVSEGIDLQEFCSALLEGYRDLMLLKTPGDLGDLLVLSGDERAALDELVAGYELGDVITIVERLCNAVPRLRTTPDPRILLESLLADLSQLERQVTIRELIEELGPPSGGRGRSGPGAPDEAGARGGKSRDGKRRGGSSDRGGRSDASGRADRASGASQLASGSARSISGSSQAASEASPTAPRGPADEAAIELPAGKSKAPAAAARTGPGTAGIVERRAGVSDPGLRDAGTHGAPEDLSLDKLRQLWEGFVTFVRQKKVTLGVSLISGKVYSYDGHRLTLRFARSFEMQRSQVCDPRHTEFLRSMFARYFGREVELVCFVEGDERAVALEDARRKQKTPEQSVRGVSEEKQPVVRRIMDEFDGEIIRFRT